MQTRTIRIDGNLDRNISVAEIWEGEGAGLDQVPFVPFSLNSFSGCLYQHPTALYQLFARILCVFASLR
jgi:hypothetical protein